MSAAKAAFLAGLRAGLRGVPAASIEDVLTDYEAHFAEAARVGRSDEEVAEALGDPLLLADEWRAEAQVASWERSATARAGWGVIWAALARGVFQASLAMLVLPMFCLLALLLALAGVSALAGGAWFAVAGHSFELPGGPATVLLAGAGLIAAGVALVAANLLGIRLAINALARLTRGSFQYIRGRGVST
jgi:uncharacterized membrane protein